MKDFSNNYTFIFSSILVIVIALLLSSAAILLQPAQEKNIELEKKQYILASLNIKVSAKDAESMYKKIITESFVINSKGLKVEGLDAFSVNLKNELKKPLELRNLPVFVGSPDSNSKAYIFPLRGKGLWGVIYGYISLKDDFNTVYGTTYDHKSETPGLGAEITTDKFQNQFIGKQIFDEQGKLETIRVLKVGADPNSKHEINSISGATITSVGVQAMISDCLLPYKEYLLKNKK